MTADQAAGDATGGIIGAAVLAESVFGHITVPVLGKTQWRMPKILKRPKKPLDGVDVNPDAVLGRGGLAGRMQHPTMAAHLAAEPVIDRQLIGAQNAVAVKLLTEHQRVDSRRTRASQVSRAQSRGDSMAAYEKYRDRFSE